MYDVQWVNGVRPQESGEGGRVLHHPKHARPPGYYYNPLHTPYPEIHSL